MLERGDGSCPPDSGIGAMLLKQRLLGAVRDIFQPGVPCLGF